LTGAFFFPLPLAASGPEEPLARRGEGAGEDRKSIFEKEFKSSKEKQTQWIAF